MGSIAKKQTQQDSFIAKKTKCNMTCFGFDAMTTSCCACFFSMKPLCYVSFIKICVFVSTAPLANADTFLNLPTLFNSSFWECQHISELANTFLTAPLANANTFLSLLTFFYISFWKCQHISKLANTF